MTSQILGALYTLTLAGLALYAIHLTVLVVLYMWHRHDQIPACPQVDEDKLPYVTIQIPLRNERYVAQRVLNAVAALSWPKDRLEIQVLDDSTDDTPTLINPLIMKLQGQGVKTTLLHRQHPAGHKAGAMAAALKQAWGEYIAIFDADFCPRTNFLRKTVPYFIQDNSLGMVQARWGHLNAKYSAVTRAQALALDAHFTVEHIARNRAGLLMNFNGTAGVWRRQAIDQAGGWQSDTVAEDLDLSYRAQLAGWKILYLPNVVAPAELPPLVAAFKHQQYRWAKGAIQVLRKLAGPIIRAPNLKIHQKLMALLHLSGYITQPLFLLLLLLTVPMILYTPRLPASVALLGTVTALPSLLYLLGQMALYRDWPRRILAYPVLMLLGLGITWSTTLALIDGIFHWGGEFVRTPKFKLNGKQGEWQNLAYRISMDRTLVGELLITLYILIALWLALQLQQVNLMSFGLIYLGGEILIITSTLWQANQMRKPGAT